MWNLHLWNLGIQSCKVISWRWKRCLLALWIDLKYYYKKKSFFYVLGHYKSHKQAHLCGKLEELSESERHIYFPSSHMRPFMHLEGHAIFTILYHFVDYCYNVTFTTRNGSYELKPNGDLQCTFKIFLPYGYRVALNLKIGDSTSTGE